MVDRLIALESAILDLKGNVLLLDLAIEDILEVQAWKLLGSEPLDGYHCLLPTDYQIYALRHVYSLMLNNQMELWRTFFDKDGNFADLGSAA